MELAKLQILVERKYPTFKEEDPIFVLFNPSSISITKVGWEKQKDTLVAADNSDSLSLDLFFDTSLPTTRLRPTGLMSAEFSSTGQAIAEGLLAVGTATDVRIYTRKIIALTEKKGEYGNPPRPPLCKLQWGFYEDLFQGVLEKIEIQYTRFRPDGVPIRAELKCSFEQWQPSEQKEKAANPIDDPIRIVKRGETLSSIAAEEYNDPALWRVIAIANRLHDPRGQLVPGQRLTVPPLNPNTAQR
ncbi:LysM peptidoglycan-binding domain-containing protein [Leptolyngbya sp. AN03gr2]|uniref:CIS tube protein n=1 Tax=unclassified Leptolyngbya TaxID=2650499 RepID=UPI003D311523